jgi:hypothetical protein
MHGYSLFSNSYIIAEDSVLRFMAISIIGVIAFDAWRMGSSIKLHLLCAFLIRLSSNLDPVKQLEQIG